MSEAAVAKPETTFAPAQVAVRGPEPEAKSSGGNREPTIKGRRSRIRGCTEFELWFNTPDSKITKPGPTQPALK